MQCVQVVEDDSTMRSLLKTLLELEGYQVKTFEGHSARDLLNSLKNESPAIIIMDVHLAAIDGLEALSALRQDAVFKHLPVIMTSGLDLKAECLNQGADAFIMKPFMPDDLITSIKSLLPTN